MLAHNLLCEILILLQEKSSGRTEWIMDSGCTNHMTGDRNLLMESSLSPSSKKTITFTDKGKSKVLDLGRVAISQDQYIDKVMLVKSLGYNLMSVSMLCDLDLVVLFGKYGCLVQMVSDNSIIFRGVRKGHLYIVYFSEGPQIATCLLARATKCWLWHRRLGHAGMSNLQKLVLKKHVLRIEEIRFTKDRLCVACEAGKMTKAKHPAKTIMTTTRPLELLHMDLFGPHKYSSFGGNCYGLVIVDDFSRYTWVHFLTFKSETQVVFKCFVKRVINNYCSKIKHIRSDNGTEFKNSGVQEFLDEMGITHEFSAPYTPQQNGLVERKNRTLIEMARTMLAEYNTHLKWWAEAINTACHIVNQVYLHKFFKKTSYELMVGKKPNVSYFKVFGTPCWICDPHHQSKFAPKACDGFMLGYGINLHTYRVYNISHHKIVETVDVRFDESDGSQREHLPHDLGEAPPEEQIKKMGAGDIIPVDHPDETHIPPAPEEHPNPDANNPDDDPDPESPDTPEAPEADANGSGSSDEDAPQDHPPRLPRVANEVQVDIILADVNLPGPLTRARANSIANFCGHFSFVSISEPPKVTEAFQEAEWIQAMQDELLQLKLNDVWELVKRPDPRIHNVIGTKWIYRNKLD